MSNVVLGLSILGLPKTIQRPVRPLSPEARSWLLWLAVYVAFGMGSTLLSYDPVVSSGSLSSLFNLTAPLLGLMLIRSERHIRWVVRGVILLGLALSVVGLVQYGLGQDDLTHRIRASLSHYMTFAGVLLLSDCLLLAWMIFGRGKKPWWGWLGLVTINLALLGSYTRNAWVGLVVALTLLLWVRKPRLLWSYLPVGVLLAFLLPQPMVERVASIADVRDPANYDRLCMTHAGLSMIAERPVFGLGPGMVSQRYAIYRHPTAPRSWVPHLHNSYMNIAAERGLVSLFAFVGLILASLLTAKRRLNQEGGKEGPRADLYLGVLAAILAFSVAGFFEDNWADTEVQRVFLFVLILPFLPAPATTLEAAEERPVV
ncbi:MAG: O-antigen ligase family protein [Deltaproteobacteria bacterium]|nr:O-antigen ligase family protein [Deltaproteobacteria bacterium]